MVEHRIMVPFGVSGRDQDRSRFYTVEEPVCEIEQADGSPLLVL